MVIKFAAIGFAFAFHKSDYTKFMNLLSKRLVSPKIA
jgi:hypothetical protein